MMVKTSKRELIHFIGIGGIGVSAIARLCMSKGNIVQGSDQILGC
jgi:UDP-N-acetylmuramate-alanine ligase